MVSTMLCLRHVFSARFCSVSRCRLSEARMAPLALLAGERIRLNSTLSANIGGREMTFDTRTLALLADGSAVVKFGDSSVLATVVSSKKSVESDFVLLKVDYREKAAAMGFIPSNYKRRDLAPTEKEILSGRLIDRSVRSLFPKGYFNETQIMCNLLASDGMNNPDVLSVNAASAALCISDIPWEGPVGAVRIGDVDDQLVVNPTRQQLESSSLNLVLASTEHRVVMLEAGGKEVSSERLVEAIKRGHQECQLIIGVIKELRGKFRKQKRSYTVSKLPVELVERVRELYQNTIRGIFLDSTLTKLSRDLEIRKLQERVYEDIKDDFPEADCSLFVRSFNEVVRDVFRNNILTGSIRCDGRSLDALRPLSCEVDLYKPLHGSALFKRGETQVFCTVTFDAAGPTFRTSRQEQVVGREITKHFFLHYEFPPFSNNEIGLAGGNSRREIGHGALAEKALSAVVPNGFPFAIRLTSQVMMSNGSSSMASVCGGSMALMDAGVPILAAVAGVACGLVTSPDAENSATDQVSQYKLMTDIMGIEDYLGDMDFKFAGTRNGMTALQADFKIPGLPLHIVEEAIHKATEDRIKVLDIMDSVISQPRPTPKENGPVTDSIRVPLWKRSQFIGPGGMNIRQLENETGVSLNMIEEEKWSVFAPSPSALSEAKTIIEQLLQDKRDPESLLEYGAIYEGRIVELKPYGVMVELVPGVPPALLHNAQFDHKKMECSTDRQMPKEPAYWHQQRTTIITIADRLLQTVILRGLLKKIFSHEVLGLEVDQPIRVKYFGRDPATGRMRISRKAILPAPKRQEYERELETVYTKSVLDSVRKTMDEQQRTIVEDR